MIRPWKAVRDQRGLHMIGIEEDKEWEDIRYNINLDRYREGEDC